MSPVPHDIVQASVALDVRLAARAMARHGLAHAYGHVSARIDDGHFLVSPPQPLGTVAAGDLGVVVPIDGALPERALPEVRIHREIYRGRPDVGGVCRFQSPAVIALSAMDETPRALHGLGTYFAPCPPLWSDVQLVRDDERAVKVAATMGNKAAIVLRGNGAVTAGSSVAEAAAFAFYLEDAARVEIALLPARATGREPLAYTPEDSVRRAVKAGALIERMWQFLCFGDPEWQPAN